MKFLLFLEFDLSLNTGYAINERESALALLRHYPNEVIVVTPQPAQAGLLEHPSFRFVLNHDRFRPIRYGRFMLQSWRRLSRIVREEGISAVITRPGPIPLIPYMLARKGVPLILKTAAAYDYSLPSDRSTKLPHRMRIALSRKLFARTYDRILGGDTVSSVYCDWFAETFGRPHGTPLALIPNGANEHMFRPQSRVEARRVLQLDRFDKLIGYVGALGSLRHLDLLIESLAQLQAVPSLGLVLVGDGQARQSLKEKAAQMGVADRVVFLGFLPYEEMPTVVNALDVAIDLTKVPMPVGGKERFGSFSQKIPQYLACGVPVIAWDTEDTKFIEQADVGRLLTTDAAELAASIRSLLHPQESSEQVKQRVRSVFEQRFSTETVAHQRLALWKELVQRQSSMGGNTGRARNMNRKAA